MEQNEHSSDVSLTKQKQIQDFYVDWFWNHYEYVIVGRWDAEFTLDVFLEDIAKGRVKNPTDLSVDEIKEICLQTSYHLKTRLRNNFWVFYDFHSIRPGAI